MCGSYLVSSRRIGKETEAAVMDILRREEVGEARFGVEDITENSVLFI